MFHLAANLSPPEPPKQEVVVEVKAPPAPPVVAAEKPKYEARFVTYCPPGKSSGKDMHLVKEIIHHPDGRKEPSLRKIYDYKRPYWITHPSKRNHKQKKEWELEDNLVRAECRQCDLVPHIARALGEGWRLQNKRPPSLRELHRSPYVYGSDISSTAIIKHAYMNRNPDLFTPFEVAIFDIETDVLYGTEDIMMATLSFKDKCVTVVRKDFVAGTSDPHTRLMELDNLYLGEYNRKRNIDWEVLFVDRSSEIIVEVFKRAHKWMPDFVAIWNIDFDLPKAVAALERDNIDPANVFSDPSVPYEHRFYRYHQGQKQKKTASGKITPRKPSDQWHSVFCPASFYFIDAMCAYRQVRIGRAEEQSYALDSILDKILGIRKLNFTMADGLVKLEWHKFMQAKHPLEYIIYNKFDCVSVEELNDKTTDLSIALPLNAEHSDFSNYNSQPRRLVDKLHFFVKERGYVFASTSDEMETDFDKMTVGLDGWIVTLPAHLVADNGLCVIKDMPWLRTNIRAHVGDLDVSAAYPTNQGVFNISKQTTFRELIEIVNVPESVVRAQGINLSAGHTNAVEFCTEMFGMPTHEDLWKAFVEDNGEPTDVSYIEIPQPMVPVPATLFTQQETLVNQPYVELQPF